MDAIFETARPVALRLAEAGHEVYFAGGCVRDHLLGRRPKDVDIATSARPEEVRRLFRRTIGVGAHFGVIIVLSGEDQFDVATFRSDGNYGDGRRPDSIQFTSAEEDVARRDFTVNGLLMDPATNEIVDHVGGQADLEAGLLRTIGAPEERFAEDHLRILRALRFACSLGFKIDAATEEAIRKLALQAATPSPERICGELERMISERDPARALRLLAELGLLEHILPELHEVASCPCDARLSTATGATVLERKMAVLAGVSTAIDPVLAWALLLADLSAEGPAACQRSAAKVLKRLRASKNLETRAARLVKARERALFAKDVSSCRRRLGAAFEDLSLLRDLHDLESACTDPAALATREPWPDLAELPPPLLRGQQLIALGVPKGRALGRILRRLRFMQLDGQLADAEAASAYVAARLNDHSA